MVSRQDGQVTDIMKLIDTISYIGGAVILIIMIFFKHSIDRTTHIALTWLLTLFLIIVLSVKFIKRKRR